MMDPKSIEHPCEAIIYPREKWGSFHWYKCGKRGKVKIDGKWYCRLHDPVRVEELQKVSKMRSKQKWDKEREVLRRHKAETYYCENLSTEYLETHKAE